MASNDRRPVPRELQHVKPIDPGSLPANVAPAYPASFPSPPQVVYVYRDIPAPAPPHAPPHRRPPWLWLLLASPVILIGGAIAWVIVDDPGLVGAIVLLTTLIATGLSNAAANQSSRRQ